MKAYMFAFALFAFLFSCRKESGDDIGPTDTGSIRIEFDNVVGSYDLKLNTAIYTNSSSEEYTISRLNYFISNLKLKTAEGLEYALPKDSSYFLVKEELEASYEIELRNVPSGDYTTISFIVGVDSVKSVAPVSERSGNLDPEGIAAGMYMSFNKGYIFLKMEGTSPASTAGGNTIQYHIAGYGGHDSPTIDNLRTVTVTAPAGTSAKVRKNTGHSPAVHIFADAAKILDGQTSFSIASYPIIGFTELSGSIANNYATMFNIDHIHND